MVGEQLDLTFLAKNPPTGKNIFDRPIEIISRHGMNWEYGCADSS
jgi:hypothetical protein